MNKLVHKFEVADIKMALDVNSGTIFSISNVIWDIMDVFEKYNRSHIKYILADKYTEQELDEALQEIDLLMEEGILYSDSKDSFSINNGEVVKAICIFASGICNLNCNYCFVYDDMPQANNIPLLEPEVGKKTLDFLVLKSKNRRNLEVDFFGGEPLLNFEAIKEIVAYGRMLEARHNKKFKFTLTTNGLLLSDEIIEFVNAEFENVVVSIDGRPFVHDAMRRQHDKSGSYGKVVENAQKLISKRNNRSYYVRGTFTRMNLDFYKDVLHLADIGFKHISIEPVVSSYDNEYALRNEDLPQIIKSYELLAKAYIDSKKKGKGFDFFHFNIDLEQGTCLSKRVSGCGAGSEYLAVTTEGDIYPCHQFAGEKDFYMGNVMLGTLDISAQMKFKHNNILTKSDCVNCWARYYCGGGCPANAYHYNNDIAKPYELGCEIEKKRLEYSLMLNSLDNCK